HTHGACQPLLTTSFSNPNSFIPLSLDCGRSGSSSGRVPSTSRSPPTVLSPSPGGGPVTLPSPLPSLSMSLRMVVTSPAREKGSARARRRREKAVRRDGRLRIFRHKEFTAIEALSPPRHDDFAIESCAEGTEIGRPHPRPGRVARHRHIAGAGLPLRRFRQ